MHLNVTELATSQRGAAVGNQLVDVDLFPNVCPICHVTIEPESLGTHAASGFAWLEVYFRCTNKKCRRQFTSLYRSTGLRGQTKTYEYERSVPSEPEVPEIEEVVKTLSSDFVRVYGQAIAAEAYGLSDIAGPGFRKSLEFLVKDYAIHLNNESSEEIKAAPLARVIEEYLTGDRVPVVSLRAAWLGNDETHYQRKWIDKDLQDLKKLIGATVHFIALEEMVVDLPKSMPRLGKPSAIGAEVRPA